MNDRTSGRAQTGWFDFDQTSSDANKSELIEMRNIELNLLSGCAQRRAWWRRLGGLLET